MDHINLALSTYGLEEIYGLSASKRKFTHITTDEDENSESSATLNKLIKEAGLVNLGMGC